MNGQTIAILGLALSTILCGIGSSLGLRSSVSATSGVLSGDPNKFSKVMVLTLLPATQGIYGLLISFMGLSHIPALLDATTLSNAAIAITETTTAETLAIISNAQAAVSANMQAGWAVLFACLPMAIVGMLSAILQGKAAATAIVAVGKKPELSGRMIMFPAMIETYALLSLVVSIILLNTLAI